MTILLCRFNGMMYLRTVNAIMHNVTPHKLNTMEAIIIKSVSRRFIKWLNEFMTFEAPTNLTWKFN